MASAVATRVLRPVGTAGKLFAFGLDVGSDAGSCGRRLGLVRLCRVRGRSVLDGLRRLGTVRGNVPRSGLRGRPRGGRRGSGSLPVLLGERGDASDQQGSEQSKGADSFHDGLRDLCASRIVPEAGAAVVRQ